MASKREIPRLGFRPPPGYAFDIEVFSAEEWLKRVPGEHFKYPSRLDFHQLILVTHGSFNHTVDFQLQSLRAKTVLAMRPGQVQRFESNRRWDGWVLIFRPESLQAANSWSSGQPGLSTDDIPVQLVLGADSFEPIRDAMVQMHQDATLLGDMHLVGMLERAQLQALLVRLLLISVQLLALPSAGAPFSKHFRKFREATEQRLYEWHQIATYANALGISEKTLSRATQQAQGLSAKTYLSKRLALEAKRMLAYTSWPIAHVADKLGFDEATNFNKFFRREAGLAPSEFRKLHRG